MKRNNFPDMAEGARMSWTGQAAPGIGEVSRFRAAVIFSSSSLGFALVIALSARMTLPVPGTPVPATLQSLAVLLAGALLGPWGGLSSVAIYLGAGLAGAPVFALGSGPVYLLGPTGGYLLGFLPAAFIAGLMARRSRRFNVLIPGFLLGILIIHLFGWAQLSALEGGEPALNLGVVPFLAFDVLKALIAATVVRLWSKGSLIGENAPLR
jgi:biotin transport system substrate-specific component